MSVLPIPTTHALANLDIAIQKYWNDAPRFEREVKKFRHIFTKSVYSEILNRINSANTVLSKLVEQSYQRATRGRRGISRRPLKRFRMARELAISLHKSIVRGNCWKCSCKDQHCVRFALDPSLSDVHSLPGECASTFQFRMVFASKLPATYEPWDRWHEVEVESDVVPSPEPDERTTMPVRPNTYINRDEGKRRVRFALATPAPAFQSASTMAETPPKPILDICSTLSTIQMDDKHRELLGCLTDQRYRHSIYHLRDVAGSLQCLSLEEVISISPSLSRIPTPGKFIFSRRDRLRLSVILACSVLQLQGSWLKSHWRARDIMFPKDATGLSQPHILWDMANCSQEPSMCRHNSASAALIQSEILFPLGLILVELSLCQNLEALRTQDDDDAVPAYANLKTASRYLPAVEMESGLKYIEVVKRCLFWSGIKETTLEDGKMQEEMCTSIIVPLFENLKDFEGASGID